MLSLVQNNIVIELTQDFKTINSVLDNPEVYQMVNGTSDIKPINKSYREELTDKGFKFLSISVNDSLIGLFSFREITSASLECHIHVVPEAHKKGYGKQAVIAGLKWFSCNKLHKKFVTYVPSNCFHVLKFMQDNNFKACGVIPEAIIYNNQLVDLLIFQRGLE